MHMCPVIQKFVILSFIWPISYQVTITYSLVLVMVILVIDPTAIVNFE